MRDWKAAGILAYTVDSKGLYVLLGKLEPGATAAPGSSRYKEGWWILGEPSCSSRDVPSAAAIPAALVTGGQPCWGRLQHSREPAMQPACSPH